MVKRALLVTTVSGFVPQFEMNSVELLKEKGYEIHYASNFNYVFYGNDNSRLDGTGIIKHQVDFSRSPYSAKTFTAYKQLCNLMKNIHFDVVHCHTPMGSFLARWAAKKTNVKTIIYTAHGFHFFKGAPLINWMVYYSAERLMAHFTDALITINKEDFNNANKFKLKKGGKVYYLPGIGIDTEHYSSVKVDKESLRNSLGIDEKDFVLLSVGELNTNKNHEVVIKALNRINHNGIKYLICGKGENEAHLKHFIKELELTDTVKVLGFRSDISEICAISDVFVFPSFREGLSVALMEAMSSGLPALASKIRGNVDLIENGKNGFLIDPSDTNSWSKYILKMKNDMSKCKKMGQVNKNKMKLYGKQVVKERLNSIYDSLKL